MKIRYAVVVFHMSWTAVLVSTVPTSAPPAFSTATTASRLPYASLQAGIILHNVCPPPQPIVSNSGCRTGLPLTQSGSHLPQTLGQMLSARMGLLGAVAAPVSMGAVHPLPGLDQLLA